MEREHTYPIWDAKGRKTINQNFVYTPEPINKGLDFILGGKVDLYNYDDGNYQTLYTLKVGPKLTLGNFKRKYFDFTELSITSKTTISSGESPFEFDQSVDNKLISFDLKQQLIGPLSIKYSTNYNLDLDSEKYNQFFKTKYELSWNRRAYNFNLYYDTQKKSGGINFEINSFNFSGYGSNFKQKN